MATVKYEIKRFQLPVSVEKGEPEVKVDEEEKVINVETESVLDLEGNVKVEVKAKFAVMEIHKLIKITSPPSLALPPPQPSIIPSYNRVWLEGPDSEKWSELTGLLKLALKPKDTETVGKTNGGTTLEGTSTAELTPTPTFLCVEKEKICGDHLQSLDKWLEDREDEQLSEGQTLEIIYRLASTLNVLHESGVGIVTGSAASDGGGGGGLQQQPIRLSDVQVISHQVDGLSTTSQLAPPKTGFQLPELRLSSNVFRFEAVLNSLASSNLKDQASAEPPTETILQFMARAIQQLITQNLEKTSTSSKAILEELLQQSQEFTPISGVNYFPKIIKNLEQLINSKFNYKNSIIFNVGQPIKRFIGRKTELKTLTAHLTDNPSITTKEGAVPNLICVHGPPGIGKTELVTQVIGKILDKNLQEDKDKPPPPPPSKNILWFNCLSSDNLTTSVYSCANTLSSKISTVDFMGSPRLLKDIFLELISTLTLASPSSSSLLIFDNLDTITSEVTDLIEIFKDNHQSTKIVIITRDISILTPLITNTKLNLIEVPLQQLTRQEVKPYLEKCFNLPETGSEGGLDKLADILSDNPAALKIITDYVRATASKNINHLQDLIRTLENFQSQFPEFMQESNVHPFLRPILIAYLFSLHQLMASLESSNDHRKNLMEKLLYLLRLIDGESGIFIETIVKILNYELTEDLKTTLSSLLSLLKRFSLVKITSTVIWVPRWTQHCIKISLEAISKISGRSLDKESMVNSYLTACSSELKKGEKPNKLRLICSITSIWKSASKTSAETCRRFDAIPEAVGKFGTNSKIFELITGFLKESITFFTAAYQSPNDIHCLKIRYLLAMESLLLRSQHNEAFLVFKSIQERCPLEPKDNLNLKMRSLIELGRIYMDRKEFEKAISCYQHVQVFSVQKIPTLEVDSDINVLSARLLHGRCHGHMGNFEESKKIILQVIPLLERHHCSGAPAEDKNKVKDLVLHAKYYLAKVLRKMGDLINALMIQTKVLEERQLIYGDKHPDVWASKLEMSLLYSCYDNHDKALIILRNILEIQETLLGAPSNPYSLLTMVSIADIEQKLGNFDEALQLYEAIDLIIEQQVLPYNHELRITTQLSQAEVLMSLGQYKESIDIYDLVYTLITSSSSSGKSLSSRGSVLEKKQKVERSMEILGNYWLSLTPENVDDPGELSALAKKHEVAVQLQENQDNQGALRFLREILEDIGEKLEENNRFLLNVKADLARVLGLVGKFNESFMVYKEIIPLMDAIFGETDELTMLCKDNMGQVFLFSGNQFLKRQMSNLKWFLL